MSEVSGASWWQSLPGMLTALGAFLTAVTGLVLALNQIGFFSGNRVPSPNVDRPAVEIARDGPKQGPSFDCKTNKSPVEQAICGDAKLSAEDLALDDLFLQVRDRLSGEPRANLVEAQRIWVSKRNQCRDPGMAACLGQSYEARIRELEAAGRH